MTETKKMVYKKRNFPDYCTKCGKAILSGEAVVRFTSNDNRWICRHGIVKKRIHGFAHVTCRRS